MIFLWSFFWNLIQATISTVWKHKKQFLPELFFGNLERKTTQTPPNEGRWLRFTAQVLTCRDIQQSFSEDFFCVLVGKRVSHVIGVRPASSGQIKIKDNFTFQEMQKSEAVSAHADGFFISLWWPKLHLHIYGVDKIGITGTRPALTFKSKNYTLVRLWCA